MKLGWLSDNPGYIGGAELTQAEFRAAAPDGVEIVDCPPGDVAYGLDAYVANNVVQFSLTDLELIGGAPVTWFHHDLSPYIRPDIRTWLDDRATHIFCSPLQREKYGREGACIPPQLDLDSYTPPKTKRRRKRTCSIAQWRNPGKGGQLISEWTVENGEVDVYGEGAYKPHGLRLNPRGPLAPEDVAQVLWRYKRFIFLPFEIEPFGRCVVEAHLAGCEVITNRLVGAMYWINENPEGLETAADDFWEVITNG